MQVENKTSSIWGELENDIRQTHKHTEEQAAGVCVCVCSSSLLLIQEQAAGVYAAEQAAGVCVCCSSFLLIQDPHTRPVVRADAHEALSY
jgi:hypothetical protein